MAQLEKMKSRSVIFPSFSATAIVAASTTVTQWTTTDSRIQSNSESYVKNALTKAADDTG